VLFIPVSLAAQAAPKKDAQNIIKIVVTGNAADIRSAPSSKGKVYGQAETGWEYLVDSATIQDKSDKSTWYKILFSIDEFDGRISQLHKSSTYDFSYPYIGAKFVKKAPLTDENRSQLDYWKQGRPVAAKIGDDFSEIMEGATPFVLTEPAVLRKDPKLNAEEITLPAETVILLNDETEPDIYYDMDEMPWLYVVGENGELLGWTDDWGKLSMESEEEHRSAQEAAKKASKQKKRKLSKKERVLRTINTLKRKLK